MIPNPSNDPLRRLHSPLVPEIKAEIGGALKAARLKKGQTLEAVGQQTRISKRFLEALEDNRFEEFPALAYLRGFLKSYCDYLDLDSEAYWRAIQSDAPAAEKPKDAPAVSAAPTRPAQASKPAAAHAAAHGAPHHGAPSTAQEHHEPDASAVLRAAAFALVLAVAVGVVLSRRAPVPSRESEPVPALSTVLSPVHQTIAPRLVVEFRADAWLSVSADGRPLFEGRAPKNARQEWTARKTFSLRTPTPDALQLTLDGKRFALPAPDAAGAFNIESQ